MICKSIFRAYDIRGIFNKTLDINVVKSIGCAFGSNLIELGISSVIVARDGRLSSNKIMKFLSLGIRSTGINVVDIGIMPTPIGYFATNIPINIDNKMQYINSCIIITGSHNPPNYNGFKIVQNGMPIYGEKIQYIYKRIINNDFKKGIGNYIKIDITDIYINRIIKDIKLKRSMKIIIDSGNGVTGDIASKLFNALGCDIIELFTNIDGNFPNHHPDPSVEKNLQDIIYALQKSDAEIGLAFDGDGDRLGVVTKCGKIIYPDRQMMLFSEEILLRNKGAKIIYDVKCTNNLKKWIQKNGGLPIICRTGHSFIKEKLHYTNNALLAGEMSGHIFFKDRWYGFDDALYSGARLLEIVSSSLNPSKLLKSLPDSYSTPELYIDLKEEDSFILIKKLQKHAQFKNANNIIKIDGIRVEYSYGFGLIRSSNTMPRLIMRFEGNSNYALTKIKKDFRNIILKENPKLVLPF